MTAKTLDWINVMGAPTTTITADFDEDARTVTVDAETLEVMAQSVVDAGILSDEDAANTASAIRSAPAVGDRFDVTENGGGYAAWETLE